MPALGVLRGERCLCVSPSLPGEALALFEKRAGFDFSLLVPDLDYAMEGAAFYTDRYVRTPDGWRIRERRLTQPRSATTASRRFTATRSCSRPKGICGASGSTAAWRSG